MDVQPREIPKCQVPGLCGLHVVEVPGDSPTFAFRCKFSDETRSEPFGLDRAVEIWLQWPDDGGMKPNLWRAIHDCCVKLAKRGWSAMALAVYRRLLADCSTPHYTTAIASDAGLVFTQLERWEEAAALFRQALAAEPTDPVICYRLNNDVGHCLARAGKHIEAEAYCRTAIRTLPKNFQAHRGLSMALMGQGRFVEAADSLLTALTLAPEKASPLRGLVALLLEHPAIITEAPECMDRVAAIVRQIPTTVPKKDSMSSANDSKPTSQAARNRPEGGGS